MPGAPVFEIHGNMVRKLSLTQLIMFVQRPFLSEWLCYGPGHCCKAFLVFNKSWALSWGPTSVTSSVSVVHVIVGVDVYRTCSV